MRRRRLLPYLIAAALVLGAAAAAALIAAAGWRGGVRYVAIPSVRLPLAAVPPAPRGAPQDRPQGLDAALPPPPAPAGGAAAAAGGGDTAAPVVALVVTGLGLFRDRSEAALRLPPAVALAVSPYADDAAAWAGRVGAAGHEAMLMLPLEAADPTRADAGPLALRPSRSGPELAAALGRLLDAGGGRDVVGLAAEAGAFARSGGAAFAPVAEALAGRGLGLVELEADDLAAVAARSGLAYATAGRAVDETPVAAAVEIALGGLEARALREGAAVGWARGYPTSFERIAAWAATLPGKGLRLGTVRAALEAAGGGRRPGAHPAAAAAR